MALQAAKERVNQLENAIRHLDFVKKHLNRNASDIKSEIHASISRNLECLRGREVALLGQVDRVLGIKEETLQHQQARLNQALGVLQTGLVMVQDDTASDKQLTDTLEKLNGIELSPEETPYIAYRADHIQLRETILTYGRVDANGLPLNFAFDDPGNSSTSLPRHLEEYEDAAHHVFYKTVEEVKRAQTSGSCITVSIPKLSTRVEDWLQEKKPPKITSLPAERPASLTKLSVSADSSAVTSSQASTPGSSCSLNNWLSIIKQHVDLEEEHDFEIIDNTSNHKASEELDGIPKVAPVLDFFSHIEKDSKAWLSSNSGKSVQMKQDFFQHIPKDTEIWLRQANQLLSELEDLKHRDFFRHIPREPLTWLRSRAYSKNVMATPEVCDYFSHISKDVNFWLLKKAGAASRQEDTKGEGSVNVSKKTTSHVCGQTCGDCDQDKWLLRCSTSISSAPSAPCFQLEDICRANEPCTSLFECVSRPNCASISFQEKSPVKNVSTAELFNPSQVNDYKWLMQAVPQVQKNVVSDEQQNLFLHIAPLKDSMWLLKSDPSQTYLTQNSSAHMVRYKSSKEETNLWLQKKKSPDTPHVSSPHIEAMVKDPQICISDWLMVPTHNQKEEKEGSNFLEVNGKEESEGWSICSSPPSVSSEQHAKDVAFADDYLNKWLL